MSKINEFIKKRPEYNFFIVPKTFGNGKRVIHFFYREQYKFKQHFLAYIDSKINISDSYNEVEKYLISEFGQIQISYFYLENECLNCKKIGSFCEDHKSEFDKWYKKGFPKIDLQHGGVFYVNKI